MNKSKIYDSAIFFGKNIELSKNLDQMLFSRQKVEMDDLFLFVSVYVYP